MRSRTQRALFAAVLIAACACCVPAGLASRPVLRGLQASGNANANANGKYPYTVVPGEFIVKFKDGVDDARKAQALGTAAVTKQAKLADRDGRGASEIMLVAKKNKDMKDDDVKSKFEAMKDAIEYIGERSAGGVATGRIAQLPCVLPCPLRRPGAV